VHRGFFFFVPERVTAVFAVPGATVSVPLFHLLIYISKDSIIHRNGISNFADYAL